MINPISPEFVLMIHKEKEIELERQIEFNRRAREQAGSRHSLRHRQSRTARAVAWMRERVLRRAPAPQIKLEEPCPTVPC